MKRQSEHGVDSGMKISRVGNQNREKGCEC